MIAIILLVGAVLVLLYLVGVYDRLVATAQPLSRTPMRKSTCSSSGAMT